MGCTKGREQSLGVSPSRVDFSFDAELLLHAVVVSIGGEVVHGASSIGSRERRVFGCGGSALRGFRANRGVGADCVVAHSLELDGLKGLGLAGWARKRM